MRVTEPAPLEGHSQEVRELLRLRREITDLKERFESHETTANEAYPGKDRRKHHDQHVSISQREEAQRLFWRSMLEKVIGAGIIAVITFATTAITFYWKSGGTP